MADHLESVKILAANYRSWAKESIAKSDHRMASIQTKRGEVLEGVIAELEELRRVTTPIPKSYGDLSDLPPELLKELTGIKGDDLEQQLFSIVKAGEGEVELDAILIELYRRHQVIQTRKFLQNKLWRMAQKGVISTVPGRKGVYTAIASHTPPPPTPAFGGGFDSDLDDDVPF